MGLLDIPTQLRDTLNRTYDDYGRAIEGQLIPTIDANQAQEIANLGAAGGRQQAGVESGRANILGGLSRIGNEANVNTARSVRDVSRFIDSGPAMFGQTPQTVGDPAAVQQYPELAPALDQVKRRTVGALERQGQGIQQGANNEMRDTNTEYDDYVQRVKGWQRDKENEAIMRYQQQRMAAIRMLAGARLEQKQQIAGVWQQAAQDFQGALSNIQTVGSKLATGGV